MEVFTTCALDYVEWKNHYPEGDTVLNGIRVRRFPVERQREILHFAKLSERIAEPGHSREDEEAWMDAQGPYSPALRDHVVQVAAEGRYDALIYFSYRYWTTCRTLLSSKTPAVLAPTAEDDGLYRLDLFRSPFLATAQFAFNSVEERLMLETALGRPLPGEIVGVGSALPAAVDGDAFRKRHGIEGPFLLYVGRIDLNKGCPELFDHFLRYRAETGSNLKLVLVGRALLELPKDDSIRALGFLRGPREVGCPRRLHGARHSFPPREPVHGDARGVLRPATGGGERALRGSARPVPAFGGGLYYANYDEFREILSVLESDASLRTRMGGAGHTYFETHYAWPVILEKYLRIIAAARQASRAA